MILSYWHHKVALNYFENSSFALEVCTKLAWFKLKNCKKNLFCNILWQPYAKWLILIKFPDFKGTLAIWSLYLWKLTILQLKRFAKYFSHIFLRFLWDQKPCSQIQFEKWSIIKYSYLNNKKRHFRKFVFFFSQPRLFSKDSVGQIDIW